jgi:hypothetical protein
MYNRSLFKCLMFGVMTFLTILSTIGICEEKFPPWKFAVMCDTRGDDLGINKYIVEKIAEDIVREKCEFVLYPGDLINGCAAPATLPYKVQFDAWKAAMAPVYNNNIKVYPVRGNHEFGLYFVNNPKARPYNLNPDPLLKEEYLKAFSSNVPANGPKNEKGLTYYATHKNVFFVGLDQYVKQYRNDLKWLKDVFETKLDKDKTPNVFVYGHNPAFIVGHIDCLAYYEQQRNEFWNLLGTAGCRAYFCGHDHLYNRCYVKDKQGNSIQQVLPGSGGAPFAKFDPPYKNPKVHGEFHNDKDHGYIVVTIDGKNVKMRWKAFDVNGAYKWSTLDSFSYISP